MIQESGEPFKQADGRMASGADVKLPSYPTMVTEQLLFDILGNLWPDCGQIL